MSRSQKPEGQKPERFADWPARLHEAIEQGKRTAFAWGTADCALWACDVVKAMTDVDLAAPLRGTYSTEGGAQLAMLGFAGRGGLAATCTAIAAAHGLTEEAWAIAMRGDLVLVETPAGPALGVCIGGRAAFLAATGLAFLPMSRAIRCWRV